MYAYQKYNNYLSLPAVVLSTISGASIFSSNNMSVKYMAASMALLSGILSGLMRQIQPGERSEKHHMHSKRWGTLIRHIQQLLATPFNQRENVEIMINQIMSEMESIDSSQPHPAPGAVRKFHQRFGRRNYDIHLYGEDVIKTIYRSARGLTSTLNTMDSSNFVSSPNGYDSPLRSRRPSLPNPKPLNREPTVNYANLHPSSRQPFGIRPTALRDKLSQLIAPSTRASGSFSNDKAGDAIRSASIVSFMPKKYDQIKTYDPSEDFGDFTKPLTKVPVPLPPASPSASPSPPPSSYAIDINDDEIQTRPDSI